MSQTPTQKFQSWFIPIGIVIIAGLLITLIVLQLRGDSGSAAESSPGSDEAPAEQPDLTFVETRDEDDVQTAGPVDAPVALVIYSDYQCPLCGRWTNDTLPEMMEYAERGDLRIEWRDVNQYGENSERAALAAHAAGNQGKFWEYHALLFPDSDHLPPEELTQEGLIDLAAELKLDLEQFEADPTSPEVLEIIQQYAAEGQELGVTGTPTFVLGGEPVVGAQPTSVFVDTFESALAEVRQ